MKASKKKAPRPEYRYRLFTTPRVNCGPEVAEFITEHSGGIIQIEPVGEVSFTPELASPIYKEQAKFHFDSEFLGEGHNVVLVHADLAEPVFWYEGYAVLSRHGLKIGRVAGPDLILYSYLALVAIVGHELLQRQDVGFLSREVSKPGPFGWEALIKSGKLPGDLHEMFLVAETRIGLDFSHALARVLTLIALESADVRAVPSSEPDPRQQAAPAPETANTGPYGVDSDTGVPEDALGYVDYAKALAAVMCDKTTGMPLTLAICAPWGRGKTALLNFLKKEIVKINDVVKKSKEPEKHDQRRADIIEFNAWEHSKSDAIWAAFYASILEKIEGTLGFWRRVGLRRYVWKRTHPAKFWSYVTSIGVLFALTVAMIYFSATAPLEDKSPERPMERRQVVTVIEHGPRIDTTATLVVREPRAASKPLFSLGSLEAKDLIAVIPGLLTILGAVWGAFLSLKRSMLGKVKKGGAGLLPQTEEDVIGYLRNVSEWLRKRYKRLDKKGLQKAVNDRLPNRFVVFIDDIDRVQPKKILQMMESIKLFQDTERFIFVLAMDTRVVRFAIGKHYKFMSEDIRHQEEMGRFYLEKMIQVPFHLPELSSSQRLSLNEQALAPHRHKIVIPMKPVNLKISPQPVTPDSGELPESRSEDVSGPTASLRSEITEQEDVIIKELLKNEDFDISPRLLKRFINIYMIARHILIIERQRASIPAEEPIPESFIKWLALSVRFPTVTKSLVKWLKSNNWGDPFGDNVFGNDGSFRFGKVWTEKTPTGWTDAAFVPFDNLSVPDLHAFGKVLREMDMDWDEVRDTLHITNCFNLVLE